MPENILEELSPTDNVDMHKLGSKEIDAFRRLRWRARHDLLFLARDVLKKDRISREFNGPIIDKLQKFPIPTPQEAKTLDRWTTDGWIYKPVVEFPANLPGKRRRLLVDFRSSYKCGCKYNKIKTNSGKYVDIQDLKVGDMVAATETEDALNQVFTKVEAVEKFIQPCTRLTFRSGRKLEVSNNHPIRMVDGWEDASNLSVGDRVAIHANTAEPQGAKYFPEAEMLGWIIGDGCVMSGNCDVTNYNPLFRQQIIDSVSRANGYAYETEDGKRIKINQLRPFLREIGIMDKNSHTKFIPEEIFKADTKSVVEFLYGLYMSDGALINSGLIYTTVSTQLAKDLQKLLLRLNVVAFVRRHTVLYKGERRPYYQVSVQDQKMIERFLSYIPWNKNNTYRKKTIYNPNCNLVPKAWRDAYPKYFFKKGTKPKNTKLRTFKGLTTYNTNKEILQWLGDNTNDNYLRFLASDEIFWDEVMSVEDIGDQETYGIQTDSKTIDIEDVVTHNTTINCECHTIQWLINYPTVCCSTFQFKLEKAETILKSIKEHFLTNNLFRALFPELCPPPNTASKQFGNAGKFSVAGVNRWRKTPRREDSVMAAALEAGLAGYHFEVMKFSDVVDTENSENEDQCLKTIHKFGQSKYLLVDPALNWIDVEGTRYHHRDLYGKIIEDHHMDVADCGGDESKAAWDIYCRGIFKVRKNDEEMKFTPDELDLPPILDANGKRIPWDVPSEPKRFPLQGLEREERIDPANFSAQMRNVPFSGRSGVSDFILATNADGKKDLPTKNVIPGKAYDKIPMAYTIVSVDPAETTTERSNHTAICVATLDRHGRVYIKDIIIGKWNPTDVGRQILDACDKHLPEYLCLEEVSATRNLLPYIAREWDLGYKHHRPTVKFNKRDTKLKKEEKIRLNLHSPFEIGDLRFVSDRIDPVGFNHLILELSQFPKGGKDDILDALSEIYAARTWFGQEFARPQKPGEFQLYHPDAKFVQMYQEAAFKAEFDGEELFPDPRATKDVFSPTISPQQLNEYWKKVGGL